MTLTAAARLLAGVLLALRIVPSAAAEPPALRVAALEYGTVNWELETIRREGLDRAEGFRLELLPVAGSAAAQVAFQGGAADAMVSDWIWVARQRAAGRDFVFLPYSKSVGGLLAPPSVESLADLEGGAIGVAGGPLDKSWLILRAFAGQETGRDLAETADPVFGAPPLIHRKLLDGELSAAVNFWHFGAKAQAAGMRELVSTAEAAAALGLDPETPLLGYVLRGETVRERPGLARGLARASRAAKALLLESDAAWEALRPKMKAADEAEFEALRDGWRAGVPGPGAGDPAGAERMLALLARLGGAALVGPEIAARVEAGEPALPDGVFLSAPE